MRPEHLDQAFVLGAVRIETLQLVACRSESATGRVSQRGDCRGGFGRRVQHVLVQCAENAIAPGVDLTDAFPGLAGRFDHPAGGGIDDSGHPTRLGVECILWHMLALRGSRGEFPDCRQ